MPKAAAAASRALTSALIPTPLGDMLAVASDEGLCLLEFQDRRLLPKEMRDVQRDFDAVVTVGRCPILSATRDQLSEYFAGKRDRFDIPLELRGTDWELSVWNELLRIPCGETRSYEDIAVALHKPGAQRAVGLANGRNRIAIVVPCHRVIQKDGTLRGYGGGIPRKAFLLDLEKKISGQSLW